MESNIVYADYSESIGSLPPHFHDCNQLIYVAEGSAVAEINGVTYQVQRGTLIILSRFEKHSFHILNNNYKRYILRIHPKQSENIIGSALYSILINRASGFKNILDCGIEADTVESYFRAIVKEYREDGHYRTDMLDSLLRILLILISRMLPDTQINSNLPLTNTVVHIQMQLEENYSCHFTLKDLSQQYHISVYYLSHIFKCITGKSIFQYLYACRIAAAKSYLAQSSIPITDIVSQCGFSDASNFSRAFKQTVGMTPTEFRSEFKNKDSYVIPVCT